jgi:hypothetical protein
MAQRRRSLFEQYVVARAGGHERFDRAWGRSAPNAAGSASRDGEPFGAFLTRRRQRHRLDAAVAVGSGAMLGLGALLLVGNLPPNTLLRPVIQDLWWLFGGFWGGLIFLVRRWRA